MRRLIQNIVLLATLNGLVVAVWVLVGGGSDAKLQAVMKNPSEAISLGFWPIWPILLCGAIVVVHAGFVLSNLLFGGKSKKRRRARAKQAIKAIDKAAERRHRSRGDVAPPAPKAPERKWVTVMFCDVAGSTSHNERLGDEEWHRVLGHIRTVVRAALSDRGGEEVGTQGDGMLARFASPADAVLCGIDIQSELHSARESTDFVPEVRIGVHAGDAVEEDGDLIGRVINLASRVTDAATPGEILVTEPVADQLVGHMELEDKGLKELKGVQQPRHLLAVRWTAQT